MSPRLLYSDVSLSFSFSLLRPLLPSFCVFICHTHTHTAQAIALVVSWCVSVSVWCGVSLVASCSLTLVVACRSGG